MRTVTNTAGVLSRTSVRTSSGSHVTGLAVLLIALVLLGLVVVAAVWPRMRKVALRVGRISVACLCGTYLVGRGIAECWVVDYHDPASYRHAWGGPSLAGVFAVHTGPGVVIVVAAAIRLRQRLPSTPQRGRAKTP